MKADTPERKLATDPSAPLLPKPAKVAEPFIFIVGAERSGTTLLRSIFNAHPDVAIPTETQGLQNILIRRREYERPAFDPRRFMEVVADDFKIRTWRLDTSRLDAELTTAECAEDAIRALYKTHAAAAGKSYIGDKTPNHTLHLPLLAAAFPESRFVHIIRDPRDAVASLMQTEFFDGDAIDAARQWATWVQAARIAGAALPEGRYVEVRYEELTRTPSRVVASLCNALGFDFKPVMLDFYQHSEQILHDTYAAELHNNLTRPVTPGLRDWRTAGDTWIVYIVEHTIGRAMADTGYHLTGDSGAGAYLGMLGLCLTRLLRRIPSRIAGERSQ